MHRSLLSLLCLPAVFSVGISANDEALREIDREYLNPWQGLVIQISGQNCRFIRLGVVFDWLSCSRSQQNLSITHASGQIGEFRESADRLTDLSGIQPEYYFKKGSPGFRERVQQGCLEGDCYSGSGVRQYSFGPPEVRIKAVWKEGVPVESYTKIVEIDSMTIHMTVDTGRKKASDVRIEFADGTVIHTQFAAWQSGTGPGRVTLPDGREYAGEFRERKLYRAGESEPVWTIADLDSGMMMQADKTSSRNWTRTTQPIFDERDKETFRRRYFNPQRGIWLEIAPGKCRIIFLGRPEPWTDCRRGRFAPPTETIIFKEAGSYHKDATFVVYSNALNTGHFMLSGDYYLDGSVELSANQHRGCLSGDCYNGSGTRQLLLGTISGRWKDGQPHGPMSLERELDGIQLRTETESGFGGRAKLKKIYPDGTVFTGETADQAADWISGTLLLPDGREIKVRLNDDRYYDSETKEILCEWKAKENRMHCTETNASPPRR